MDDQCTIPDCGGEVDVVYLDRGLCSGHWEELNADDDGGGTLRMALGIPRPTPPAEGEGMEDPKIDNGPVVGPATEVGTSAAETAGAEETEMKKNPVSKSKKKNSANAKPDAKPKAAKAKTPKPKKERAPREDLVVFACRVAETERDAFHKATGPGGATRFARKLMVTFSKEDESGFRALLKEAREARG